MEPRNYYWFVSYKEFIKTQGDGSAAIATPVAMGASALVKPAVEGLTNSVIDMTARSIIEGSSSGNVSLIQFAFDIVVEEMTEE